MRSLPLLLLGVALPGSATHLIYGPLLRHEHAVGQITVVAPALPAPPPPPAVSPGEDRTCAVRETVLRSLGGQADDHLHIRAGTGTLQVRGIDGATRINVEALICVSDRERLASMDVELRRLMGPDVRVETLQPDPDGALGWSDDEYARIDLEIEVPRGTDVTIADASGPVSASGVGELRVQDGSGEVEITDVLGSARVEDGSGSIRILGVSGDLDLRGGSGSIAIEKVSGAVTVRRASGAVQVQSVGGSVRLLPTVTGSVSVDDVGGDLVVEGAGTVPLHYERVRGRIVRP